MMKKSRFFPSFLVFLVVLTLAGGMIFLTAQNSHAQDVVASVDGRVITSYDVDQRLILFQIMAQQKPSPELRKQIIDELIKEQIIIGEARRLGVRVPKEQIEAVLEGIAKGAGKTLEELSALLWETESFDLNSLRTRLEVRSLWERLTLSQFKNEVRLSPSEIDVFLLKNKGREEIKQERHEYEIRGVTLLVKKDASEMEKRKRWEDASSLSRQVNGCDSLMQLAKKTHDTLVQKPVWHQAEKLPPKVRETLENMSVGHGSQPYPEPEGVSFFVLCEKRTIVDEKIARQEALSALTNDALSLFSRKYLSELKRKAVIERY